MPVFSRICGFLGNIAGWKENVRLEKKFPFFPVYYWLLTFFGSAFSIMTFNNDVDVGKLFSQIYEQVTGTASGGFTILEITYSLGLALGVLFFFNHFGHMKITSDPTPMQVQMRLYENDVNTTLMEDANRKQAQKKQQ